MCFPMSSDRRRVHRISQTLHISKALKHRHCRSKTSSLLHHTCGGGVQRANRWATRTQSGALSRHESFETGIPRYAAGPAHGAEDTAIWAPKRTRTVTSRVGRRGDTPPVALSSEIPRLPLHSAYNQLTRALLSHCLSPGDGAPLLICLTSYILAMSKKSQCTGPAFAIYTQLRAMAIIEPAAGCIVVSCHM
jgi:hypothetical protein